MEMKALIYSTHGFDKPFLAAAASYKHHLMYTEQALNASTVHLAEGCQAVALFTGDDASAEVLQQLHDMGVRYIALRSVGYDHVDLVQAKALGLKVANVPAYSPHAIAEHAVALLLALNRRIPLGQQLMHHHDFRLDQLVGFDLYGKTVGVVGTGKIGSAFARIMHGFGCRLLAFDPVEQAELVRLTGIRYTSLEDLCAQSDVISIHCPLQAATHHLFRESLFSSMKKGVVLINTARGGIIRTADLLDALDSGIVSAAGLDVYEHEKGLYFEDLSHDVISDRLFDRLLAHPQVLLTGHQAFLTNEALEGIATTTIENLDAWDAAKTSVNEIGG